MLDAVVIGCGGVGSFALRALARETKNILGVERFALNHSKGSSHGQSRIYRRAYFEDPNYVPWIDYSLDQFSELEALSGLSLKKECGMLLAQEDDGGYLRTSLQSAKEHNIPVETLDANQLRQRFPQFRFLSEDMMGIYEPGAGVLRPERTMKAAIDEAMSNGAKILENTQVQSIKEVKDIGSTYVEVIVKYSNGEIGRIEAKYALIAAGAWASELIPSYASHLTVTRQLQCWVNITDTQESNSYKIGQMPAFVIVSPGWPQPLYGLPADDGCDGDVYKSCIKVGVHERPVIINPNQNSSHVTIDEVDEMKQAMYTGLNQELCSLPYQKVQPCLYTMTKDSDYLIGAPQEFTNVCTVSGLSGHGFKMIPALGQMLADFALERGSLEERWNTSFCSPRRFGV